MSCGGDGGNGHGGGNKDCVFVRGNGIGGGGGRWYELMERG